MKQHRWHITSFVVAVCLLAGATAPAAAGTPNGSVTLSDGRVLPPPPDAMMQPSIQGTMLLEHPTLSGSTKSPSAPLASSSTTSVGTIGASPDLVTTGATVSGPAGALPNGLRKEVLGFLPYWMLNADTLASLRYDLVSTIAYFSVGANANGTLTRGTSTGWTGWTSDALTGVITNAHARGIRVVPTITLMSWSGDYSALTALLTTDANRAKLIGEIAGIIGDRGADGVNIDFEPVPSSLRDAFTTFIRELKAGLTAAGVGSYLTVDTMAGAATWATGYDVQALSADGAADALMVMAYDFSWSGSARAGGVAPLKSPYIFDATDAVTDYLKLVDGSKLIWGIPYYGRTWATASGDLNARTCSSDATLCPDAVAGSFASKAYYYTGSLSQATQYGRNWDDVGGVPWYAWHDDANNVWRQGYYDDAQSLDLKYRLVQDSGLAGIGIWTLLMDAGTNDLANVIEDRFVKTAERLAGDDRYATAAAVSARFFAPGAPIVFVATGAAFPDALAAGPAAAKLGGPLLLVSKTEIPDATKSELQRLKPQQIVVMGGTGAISSSVASQLAAYTSGTVRRISGADRFDTAAKLSAAYFKPGLPMVFVATGLDYPDALAGVSFAASVGAPVLLTGTTSLPAATVNELKRLQPKKIVILGGTAVVSDTVRNQLEEYAANGTDRLWGATRYETAVAISQAAFGDDIPTYVFVATGQNFPDGLAGAAAAGALHAPMLLVPRDSLPDVVAPELPRLNAPHTCLLGMSGAISDAVLDEIQALWG